MTDNLMSHETAVAVPSGPVVWTLAQRELVRFFRQRSLEYQETYKLNLALDFDLAT